MGKKEFEKSAHMLLKYGIGKNIEEAREKLNKLIKAQKAAKKK